MSCRDTAKKHTVTRTHAAFAERFIRTFENKIIDEVEFSKNYDWSRFVEPVLKQYNNTEHRAHDMKPKEAHDERYAGDIKMKLLVNAQFKRKYPDLEVGDQVRLF